MLGRMVRFRSAGILTAALVAAPFVPTHAADDPAARWWAHVAFLASDALEGRDTGSEGHTKAAAYVAEQFKAAGLAPAGTSGYLQPVRFTSRRIVEARSSLTLVRDGVATPVALGTDAAFSMRIDPAPTVDAPLAFVGYGLSIPELQIDDLAGQDLRGKVAVYLVGSPAGVPDALGAHAQSAAARWAALKQAGAIGAIVVQHPGRQEPPWERAALARLQPAMSLADASLLDTAGQQVAIAFNPASAERLFAGSGHTFAEIVALAGDRKPLPRFPLPTALRATVQVETAAVTSDNVAGVLRGGDPALRDEYVVLSGHLDHLGIGGAVNGDRIYNGAMDNASGIASLIETAAALARAPERPKRSVLFVAVTAEEKGLLGSRYFAARPTVPAQAIVANINMDMFLPLFPMKSVMVFGLDESGLGAAVRQVATRMGFTVQGDPEPLRNRFIRSDQYSFIRQGVPAVALKVGYPLNSPEAATVAAWTKERYHAPSDDLQQPVDREAAVGFNDLLVRLTTAVADQPQRPRWNDTSFFKRFAGPPK
jgi:Zn-dependent M28 family amino/carboxypeptidase